MTRSWAQRTMAWFTIHTVLHDVDVALFMPTSRDEETLIFQKVGAALGLVKEHAPRRFAAMRTDLRQLCVFGRPDRIAQYDPDRQVCELYVGWVKSEEASPELVASAIVHEAEHARLWRLGFRYAPEVQHRVERICHRAERVFGKRLPNGASVVAQAQAGMQLDEHFHGREQQRFRERAALRQLAQRVVLVWPFLWFYDFRAWRERPRGAARPPNKAISTPPAK